MGLCNEPNYRTKFEPPADRQVSTRVSFQEFPHTTTGTLMNHIDLEMTLQSFISSEMARPLSWPCAVYPEFVLSVGYSDGFLDLKYRDLGVMSLFSKDEAKPQTETG